MDTKEFLKYVIVIFIWISLEYTHISNAVSFVKEPYTVFLLKML